MRTTDRHSAAPFTDDDGHDLRVGLESMDHDHRALVEACDRLLSMARRQLAWQDLMVAISELLASIEVHFISEEERFPHHYPHRDHHLKEHDTLRQILSGLLSNRHLHDLEMAVHSVRTLFIDHIRRFDQSVWGEGH